MSFSPRNGEVILKKTLNMLGRSELSFSPRNGEVILKNMPNVLFAKHEVSVPAMGK